jgi:hypothetical protein
MALGSNSNNNLTRIGTVSGTSISFGTMYGPDTSAGFMTLGYHAASGKLIQVIGPNVKARVATISGTSLSFGDFTTIISSAVNYKGALNYDSTSEVIVFYCNPYYASAYQPRAIPLTVSGTTVVKGVPLVDSPFTNAEESHGTESPFSVCVSGKYYIYEGHNSQVMAEMPILGAGAATYLGSPNYVYLNPQFPVANDGYNNSYGINSGGAGEIGIINQSRIAGSSSDLLSYSMRYNTSVPFFVGVAAENISSGAEGKVTVTGGINTSVSGLSAGSEYGPVDNAATLSALSTNTIGRALASNKLYVSNIAAKAQGKR